ncbi:similar to Saccharomyces cerevisiae YGL155W CDC43 Beta subunit of geranylgeranyltransferase type I [Maudiozyma saulgeensis]|uniref:Similar to Saccharomyces cerevisiae YGL155W CDC43 Beta subunit of geranylgeranyltransferase type I n=1 Tax=Maudiozyma saulgeensis TaxID=1789683 RepID=A0A1X7R0K7_9SACH|nr:similar to Saccharomyces cerevisiae YGL155W CDC43 Beta subunit of geranylgeranyltransferase type I [Kazachstania saulgeensis]
MSTFTELNLQKHIRFLKRHLSLLPASHQHFDVNLLAIVFYALESLSALGQDIETAYCDNLKWIRNNYVSETIGDEKISGFVGGQTLNIPDTITLSLPNTLFGLLTLILLNDKEFFDKIVDIESICRFVSSCQLKENGAFVSVLDYKSGSPSVVDSHDLRFSYIAVTILYILGCRKEEDFAKYIDVRSLVSYIMSQSCSSGGFGAYGEPHAGYTSCAVSALKLLNKLDLIQKSQKERTIDWLLERQVSNEGFMGVQDISNECYDEEDHGGFQGRENKYADTCYAFWCLNSLSILEPNYKKLCNTELVKKYLLDRTQDVLTGGFMKNDEEDADLYHTCLGITTLKLIEGECNGLLCIPSHAARKFNL